MQAIITRDLAEVERLLAAGEPVDVASENQGLTPLAAAAITGNLEIAQLLLDAGAQVDLDADPGGATTTALSTAVFLQQVDMARLLVANGADPDR